RPGRQPRFGHLPQCLTRRVAPTARFHSRFGKGEGIARAGGCCEPLAEALLGDSEGRRIRSPLTHVLTRLSRGAYWVFASWYDRAPSRQTAQVDWDT